LQRFLNNHTPAPERNRKAVFNDQPVPFWWREIGDQEKTNFFDRQLNPPPVNLYTCNKGYLLGTVLNTPQNSVFDKWQPVYVKHLFCGREWCQTCGLDYSIPHQRRISRLYGKILAAPHLGYMVITVPQELRPKFLEPQVLRDFKTYIKRKLKRSEIYGRKLVTVPGKPFINKNGIHIKSAVTYKTIIKRREGYKYGLIRYHYAGDDGQTYKPHLNILLPAKYLPPELLEKWRRDVAAWFVNYFNLGTNAAPIGNVYYAYTDKNHKKIHWLQYITRSTLTNPDKPLKELLQINLKNFRNTTTWGKWPEPEEQIDQATAAIVKNICIQTNLPIKWDYFARSLNAITTCLPNDLKNIGLGVLFSNNAKLNEKRVKLNSEATQDRRLKSLQSKIINPPPI
jgi:hypothetical protein